MCLILPQAAEKASLGVKTNEAAVLHKRHIQRHPNIGTRPGCESLTQK